MRKNILYTGIGCLVVGAIYVLLGMFKQNSPYICGFGGGFIGSGIMMIKNYLHWSKPENKEACELKLKKESIDRNDERKIMLRDKSGRITYIITLVLLLIINIIFSIMNVDLFVLKTLGLLWISMYICGIVVFKILSNKF